MVKTALIVDDVESHRLAVASYLVLVGFKTIMAINGIDALEKLKFNNVQLIVSDIEMPNMNGFELLARVRRNPTYRSLPIIMCSSVNNPMDIQRARKLGASGYIVKPYSAKKFTEILINIGLKSR